MNNYPAKNEVAALLREAYAIDALPDGAVSRWMAAHGFDLNLHAAWGSVMALPTNAPVPLWAQYKGRHWCDAGLRLLAPLCGPDGVVRSFVAQSVTPDHHGATVPDGRSHKGLVVACPTARRTLLNGANLYRVVITGSFRTWLHRAEAARRQMEGLCVLGLLSESWTQEWAHRLAGSHVTLVQEPDANHLSIVQDALKKCARAKALTFELASSQEAA